MGIKFEESIDAEAVGSTQALAVIGPTTIDRRAGAASMLVPKLIADAGENASLRFLDFFTANIRNPNTRAAYAVAVRAFFAWLDAKKVAPLAAVRTHHVSAYVEALGRRYRAPTVKQHLAAIRMLFDWLIVGQIFAGPNPAAAVRGPKHVVKKGKTSVLDGDEAKKLIDSIDVSTVVGLRDRALIALLVYTFARVSAALHMNVEDLLSSRETLVGQAAREGRQATRDAGAPPARTFSRRLSHGAARRGRRGTRQGLALIPHARRARAQAAL